MTQQLNKLYSKEQIEEWASKRADDAGRLSRQLLDIMRENEQLRNLMLKSHNLITQGEIFEATAILKIEGENRYKGLNND